MSQNKNYLFTIAIFTLNLLVQGGCALFSSEKTTVKVVGPVEKVFYGTFDDVWRATAQAMQSPTSYPLRISNMDTALIETEVLKGSQAWFPAHSGTPPSPGFSYRLIVKIIKGNVGKKSAYKVSVQKLATLQRDFFSDPEKLPSDGLEEQVLLYRIDRELQIERGIRKAHNKQNPG